MCKLLKYKNFVLISPLVFSPWLAAQEDVVSPVGLEDTPAMEEIVVWGTQVYASSVNLDEEAIAIKQADHLSDLLRTIPGVDVGGAHSLNQRITIRSMDDKDLAIRIDGAAQNSYMYHHMGNLQIHSDILKAVEIDVGKNSVINSGLGGGARFQTKAASDLLQSGERFGLRVQSTYADNASNSAAVSAFGQLSDQVDFLAYYNRVDRDNYTVGGGEILDENGAEVPGTDGEVRGLSGELNDALLKFGWDLSDSQRVTLSHERYEDEGDYSYRPDMGLATDIAIANRLNIPLVYPTEFSRDTTTLNYHNQWSETTRWQATAYQNTSTMWRDERGLASWRPPAATINEGQARNSGVNLLGRTHLDVAGRGHGLTYGGEWRRYRTDFRQNGNGVAGEDMSSTALYLEDSIGLANGLTLIPGLRYDIYDVDSTTVNDTYRRATFGLTGEYRFADYWLLELGATQLFKAPEIGEVFTGAGLYDTPNPAIDAETGVNSELGVSYRGNGLAAGITLFRTQVDDYIYDYTASGKDNVGGMEIHGREVFGQFSWRNLTALLTYSDAESELAAFTEYTSLDGARIDRQQGETVSLNLDYQLGDVDLYLHWDSLWVDDVAADLDLDGATLNNAKDSYAVHNLSLRWLPRGPLQGLELTLGVDNVFDEFYASQSSRTGVSLHPLFRELYLFDYEPGRNFKATLAYQF